MSVVLRHNHIHAIRLAQHATNIQVGLFVAYWCCFCALEFGRVLVWGFARSEVQGPAMQSREDLNALKRAAQPIKTPRKAR
jgi:hypothetical protein